MKHPAALSSSGTVYDRLAPFYEPSGLGRYAERFSASLIRILRRHPAPSGPWLDLGCGTGILLSRGLPRRRRALGLDLSLGMLALARRRHRPVILADVRQIPLEDGCVALATATFDVANHLAPSPQLERFLREVARVLRPGGLLVFDLNTTDHLRLWHGVEEETPLGADRLRRRARFDERRGLLEVEMVRCSAGGERELIGTLVERAYAPSLVRGLLRRAGFRRIEREVGRRARGYDLRDLWTARRRQGDPR